MAKQIKRNKNGKSVVSNTRNRTAGHNFEQAIARDLKNIYPDIATSRLCNTHRDGQKVDLCNKDEHTHGRLPYNFQLKNVCGNINYSKLHDTMPSDLPHVGNIIVHNYTIRKELSTGGVRFETIGTYAFMKFRDCERLLAYRKGYELLMNHIDALDPETKLEVQRELTAIGL